MKMYKVLRVVDGKAYSPFQDYEYGNVDSLAGVHTYCSTFDDNPKNECSYGFYATGVDGLVYSLNYDASCRVFEVEMEGKSVEVNPCKKRFEHQTILRMLSRKEVRNLIREYSKTLDWDYYNACYPVNPLKIDKPLDESRVMRLLKTIEPFKDFMFYAVEDLVNSHCDFDITDIICQSICGNIGKTLKHRNQWNMVNYMGISLASYITTLFPTITNWHKSYYCNNTVVSAGLELWNMGLLVADDSYNLRVIKGIDAREMLKVPYWDLREVKL